MKYVISILMALALAAGFVACAPAITEEDAAIVVMPEPAFISMAISASTAYVKLDFSENMDVKWDISVSDGRLCVMDENTDVSYVAELTAENGDTLYWEPVEYIDTATEEDEYNADNYQEFMSFIDMIAISDGNIVGYAVAAFHIEADENAQYGSISYSYRGEIVKAAVFPRVDGEFQNISREYAASRIADAHEEARGGR